MGDGPERLVVPLFPLPDVALLPGALLPLHVFEARYRALVSDALARDGRLALVRLEPGWERGYAGRPAIRSVAGVGRLLGAERLASGRFHIVVRGEARVRIEGEIPADTLYRLARVVRLVERTPAAEDAARLVARVAEGCARLLAAVGRPPDLLDEVLDRRQPPGALADRVAAAVVPTADERQALLEELDVASRLERLVDTLATLLRAAGGGSA